MPAHCRQHIIVIGSLAAAYHLFAEREDGQVRTKDIDCILVPRVEAVRAGKAVADALLAAGWRRRRERWSFVTDLSVGPTLARAERRLARCRSSRRSSVS